jgi:hypothetical protein
MMRIVFIDIDGVLLSAKAWCLSANAEARDMMLARKRLEALSRMTFDACAVALLNRLCEKTAAQLVIHSNWRRTVGARIARETLIRVGVEERNFHSEFCCPLKLTSTKRHDVTAWLMRNRVAPEPKWPEGVPEDPWAPRTKRQEKLLRAYNRQLDDHGIEFLVIDDDAIGLEDRQIRVDPYDGFSAGDYRVAVAFFEAVDREIGVWEVDPADFKRARRVLRGRVAALEWLHREATYGATRAAFLNQERLRREADSLSLWTGSRADDAEIERRRDRVWRELRRR